MKKLQPNQRAMIKALEKNLCNVSKSAKEVGICRETHYLWLNENQHYKKAFEEMNESLKDDVEEELYSRTKLSDTALIFYCKTKMKDRGYTERQEVYNHEVKPLTIEDFYKDN